MAKGPAPQSAPKPTDAGPLLVVISGPSGAGKDSVLSRMMERCPAIHVTVTMTTRPQREVRPEDHQFLSFVSEETFDRVLAEEGLLEHAQVYGYSYGVPKEQVTEALSRGEDAILRVDVQGAATIKKLVPAAVLIFLAPPSVDELKERLKARGLDDPDAMHRKLEAVEEEMSRSREFDHVVVNERDALEHAVDQVLAIMTAERRRVGRKAVAL